MSGQLGRVVHTLGTRIAGGDLAPGEPLPTEEELVGELGVGRSSLREAMKVLGGKGLVESRTRAGTRVRPREAWHLMDPDVLGWRYQTAPTHYATSVGQHERVATAIRRHHARRAEESMRQLAEGARGDLRFYAGTPES